jgi:chromosome segregation ATPase
MMTNQIARYAAAVVLVIGLGAGNVSAQTAAPAAPNRDVMADVLAELRALRAELRQASEAGIKAQLLVGRLQLQEQRIGGLSKQLAETEQQLSDNDKARGSLKAQVDLIDGNLGKSSATEREEGDQVLAPLKGILQQLDKREQELRTQETYLTNLIAEEQSRWASFNSMLDQLAANPGGK